MPILCKILVTVVFKLSQGAKIRGSRKLLLSNPAAAAVIESKFKTFAPLIFQQDTLP